MKLMKPRSRNFTIEANSSVIAWSQCLQNPQSPDIKTVIALSKYETGVSAHRRIETPHAPSTKALEGLRLDPHQGIVEVHPACGRCVCWQQCLALDPLDTCVKTSTYCAVVHFGYLQQYISKGGIFGKTRRRIETPRETNQWIARLHPNHLGLNFDVNMPGLTALHSLRKLPPSQPKPQVFPAGRRQALVGCAEDHGTVSDTCRTVRNLIFNTWPILYLRRQYCHHHHVIIYHAFVHHHYHH